MGIAVGGFIPNESNEEFPSLHCNPTLPINGEVEQPFIDRPPFLNPLFENDSHENEELGSLGLYVLGFKRRFEVLGVREMKGMEVVDMAVVKWDFPPENGGFRRENKGEVVGEMRGID